MTCYRKPTLEFKQGASLSLPFTMRDENGDPYDWSADSIASEIRDEISGDLLAAFDIEEVDPSLGTGRLVMSALETLEIPAGTHLMDIVLTLADDTRHPTETAAVKVLPVVTPPELV